MKAVAHLITIAVAAAVLVGIPFAAFADVEVLAGKLTGLDAVSSASVIQDAPSGRFTILVNRDRHADAQVLADWVTFFSGQAAPLIFEDIECVALAEDAAGIEMARSLQSRLPENQMSLAVEEAAIALSKADAGLFDVIVMSDEAFDAYDGDTVVSLQDVEVVSR